MTSTLTDFGLSTGTWTIDPAHSEVGFVVRHLMTKVRGSFDIFSGEITVGDSVETSSVSVTIEVDSVNTRQPQRDAHIRSADFFAENKKTITFVSTGVRQDGDDYLVTGDLTVNGVTRSIDLATEFVGVEGDAYGSTKAGFDASTTISRKDFGVDFNVPLDGGKLLVGDKVEITLSVQAAKV
ncbi:MAG TPA: YceI family protein [Actinopolymorphaceae bacterium]|jgi:polyisoprenoid-binding protein YceI